MRKGNRKLAVTAIVAVVLVGGSVLGRSLLDANGTANTGALRSGEAMPVAPGASQGAALPDSSGTSGLPGTSATSHAPLLPSLGASATTATTSSNTSSGSTAGTASGGALPPVPVFPTTPQVIRTATLDLRLGAGAVQRTITTIAALAAFDGGYVQSSSMSGGTAKTTPNAGNVVVRVLATDFSQAMTQLSSYGHVTSQQIAGQDVTDEVAANAASLQVLQEEVNLLQSKLDQTTDINTFLEIENQLFPVEQQLQQLENQQAVLESSAALATITVGLAAPGAPVPVPVVQARVNAATAAWRYLRHNSLAVLDGLAVGVGWALPVLVLGGLVWLGGSRYRRRRRSAVSPAA